MAKAETEQGMSRREFVVDGLTVLGLVVVGKLSYPVFQEYWESVASASGEIGEEIELAVTPRRPELESKVFFQEDFKTLEGWNVSSRGGGVWVDGQLHLEASFGPTFPVVERKEDVFPTEGSFELNVKLEFPEKTGYGVGFFLVDENDNPVFHIDGGYCANPYIRTALNNGEEINPFILYSNNGWDNSLSNPDISHTFSLFYKDGIGYLSIDGTYVGELSSLSRPVGIRIGNPLMTAEHGEWTKMKVDFLETKQTLEPSFTIPEVPPFYKPVLFREIGGQEIKDISSLILPSGESWALEFEGVFSNFSAEKPAIIQLGNLKILASKGWKRFISLSAGKEGERFGFLITPDVGKPVKGKESLYRPKEPHTFRLVHLGLKEYLFIDGILVGQGPGEKIGGEIPVAIVENLSSDATKVEVRQVRIFSLAL